MVLRGKSSSTEVAGEKIGKGKQFISQNFWSHWKQSQQLAEALIWQLFTTQAGRRGKLENRKRVVIWTFLIWTTVGRDWRVLIWQVKHLLVIGDHLTIRPGSHSRAHCRTIYQQWNAAAQFPIDTFSLGPAIDTFLLGPTFSLGPTSGRPELLTVGTV